MKALALWLLRGYKRWISPSFPPSCRYVPTCSEYAMEAVERYGVTRGGAMAAWRLLRCHPLAKGGLDPVVKAGNKGREHRVPHAFAFFANAWDSSKHPRGCHD
jgi:putative membrane protein insertion efficiency factor